MGLLKWLFSLAAKKIADDEYGKGQTSWSQAAEQVGDEGYKPDPAPPTPPTSGAQK